VAPTAQAPLINPRYLSAEEDRRVASDAIRLTRRIAAQPALARYSPEEFLPGAHLSTDEQLAKAAGDIGTTIFICGHLPDGPSPATRWRVVDTRLARDRRRRPCAWSTRPVMPTITSGNTNSPTIMIAERGAETMREDRKARR
jgi:choline dehydrogenase